MLKDESSRNKQRSCGKVSDYKVCIFLIESVCRLASEVASVRVEESRKYERVSRDYETRLKREQLEHQKLQSEHATMLRLIETLQQANEERQQLVKKVGFYLFFSCSLLSFARFLQSQAAQIAQSAKGGAECDALRASSSSSSANSPPAATTTNAVAGPTTPRTSVSFGTIERIDDDGRVLCQTIAEWEQKFVVLRKEYETERAQRKTMTKLLVDLSKDVKVLLNNSKEPRFV